MYLQFRYDPLLGREDSPETTLGDKPAVNALFARVCAHDQQREYADDGRNGRERENAAAHTWFEQYVPQPLVGALCYNFGAKERLDCGSRMLDLLFDQSVALIEI